MWLTGSQVRQSRADGPRPSPLAKGFEFPCCSAPSAIETIPRATMTAGNDRVNGTLR